MEPVLLGSHLLSRVGPAVFKKPNMENTTENADQGSSKKVECLVKDVDLKAEMEKAKEWAKNNPIPTGLVGIFALYLVFGYGADLIVTVLGFAYPAYQS